MRAMIFSARGAALASGAGLCSGVLGSIRDEYPVYRLQRHDPGFFVIECAPRWVHHSSDDLRPVPVRSIDRGRLR